jgi:hypothetical protein
MRKGNVSRKIRTQENCGPQKKVTAAGSKITHCADHRREVQNKDNVSPESSKGGTFEKRLWKGPECNNGIRDHGLRLHLRRKREFNKTLKKTLGLEIGKQATVISSGLQKIKNWTLWKGRPPPKWKKKQR